MNNCKINKNNWLNLPPYSPWDLIQYPTIIKPLKWEHERVTLSKSSTSLWWLISDISPISSQSRYFARYFDALLLARSIHVATVLVRQNGWQCHKTTPGNSIGSTEVERGKSQQEFPFDTSGGWKMTGRSTNMIVLYIRITVTKIGAIRQWIDYRN